MGFLDNAGLARLWGKVTARRRVLTAAEYAALSEEEKNADVVYMVPEEEGGGGGSGGGVSSFNGRSGAVLPEAGDYSTEQIEGLSEALASKQDLLTAGDGVSISGNTISANAGTYSTKERVVGKWIDGKTIYEISFTGTLPGEGVSPLKTIPGMTKMFHAFGTFIYANNRIMIPYSWYFEGTYRIGEFVQVGSVISLYQSTSAYKGSPIECTVQYFK